MRRVWLIVLALVYGPRLLSPAAPSTPLDPAKFAVTTFSNRTGDSTLDGLVDDVRCVTARVLQITPDGPQVAVIDVEVLLSERG